MSMIKSHNKKILKGAACAVAVALSGAVPTPGTFMNQPAFAGSATTVKVTGSFVAGVTITKVANADFAKFAVSVSTGTATLKTGGTGAGNAVFFGSETNGVLNVKAVNTTKPVNVTLSGVGALVIGGAAVGTATLRKVIFGGAAPTITTAKSIAAVGAATTAKGTIVFGSKVDTTTKAMPIGAVVQFAGRPRGTFQATVTITMGF